MWGNAHGSRWRSKSEAIARGLIQTTTSFAVYNYIQIADDEIEIADRVKLPAESRSDNRPVISAKESRSIRLPVLTIITRGHCYTLSAFDQSSMPSDGNQAWLLQRAATWSRRISEVPATISESRFADRLQRKLEHSFDWPTASHHWLPLKRRRTGSETRCSDLQNESFQLISRPGFTWRLSTTICVSKNIPSFPFVKTEPWNALDSQFETRYHVTFVNPVVQSKFHKKFKTFFCINLCDRIFRRRCVSDSGFKLKICHYSV